MNMPEPAWRQLGTRVPTRVVDVVDALAQSTNRTKQETVIYLIDLGVAALPEGERNAMTQVYDVLQRAKEQR